MVELPHSPHAVVTGAARGIGREIASQLTKAGAVVTASAARAPLLKRWSLKAALASLWLPM